MKIKIETIPSEIKDYPDSVKISDESGKELSGIVAMTIQIQPNMPVVAYIDMMINPKTIEAEALLSFKSLFEAADYYGFNLVRKEAIN